MHAKQANEQTEEEARDATGDQYPRVPGLFRLRFQSLYFRALLVQFRGSIAELRFRASPFVLFGAVVDWSRMNSADAQPRVQRLALAAIRVEFDRIFR